MIAGHEQAYSEAENQILSEGEKHFKDFEEMKAKSLKMVSPLATSKIAYDKKDDHAWGWTTTTVRAGREEVLAWAYDAQSRATRREDDIEKSVTQVNGHNVLVCVEKGTPKIVSDLDFLGRMVWKKEGEGFVLVTEPTESDLWPTGGDVVHGKCKPIYVCTACAVRSVV